MAPLTDEDRRWLEDHFVTQAECEDKNDKIQAAIAKMSTDIAVMKANSDRSIKTQDKILTAVITAVVGLIIATILAVIKMGGIS